MSMEYRQCVFDAHPKTILCVQLNPIRREIYTGGEDGVIRVWESETGKLINVLAEHTGWVTCLYFCKDYKVLISASVDGCIIVWGPSGKMAQKVSSGFPIHCLSYNSKRQQIMVGHSTKVRLYQLLSLEETHLSNEIIEPHSVCCHEHTDIVSSLVTCEGRFYSAGYDHKIVIYDVAHHGSLKLKVVHVIQDAHDAAITCMVYGKDADNAWLISGSFDRVVKFWSLEGNLLHKFEGFGEAITSLCYVSVTQSLWITAGSNAPIVYDPRSAINISDFVVTDDVRYHHKTGPSKFKKLIYVPDVNEVIGITNRRSFVSWRYNPQASISMLRGHSDMTECLALTLKEPILIFSAGDDGLVKKWERLQLNPLMYSQDVLAFPHEADIEDGVQDLPLKSKNSDRHTRRVNLRKRVFRRLEQVKRRMDKEERSKLEPQLNVLARSTEKNYRQKQKVVELEEKKREKKQIPLELLEVAGYTVTGKTERPTDIPTPKLSAAAIFYYENLDYLITGYDDAKIRVWGYNKELLTMKHYKETAESTPDLPDGLEISSAGVAMGEDDMTNRVAGMALLHTFEEHRESISAVTCFAAVGGHWLLSASMDRRLCLWNLTTGHLQDTFRSSPHLSITTSNYSFAREDLAADCVINEMTYAPELNVFGYASSDKQAYLRRFSTKGDEMVLVAVLQGHEGAVTQIKWKRSSREWVTGSEDGTIRIWPESGLPCLKVLRNSSPVTTLCIDLINGYFITGSTDKRMRVINPEKTDDIVQTNLGHTDEIRCILHIPSRSQYVSASWDNTIRFWHAYRKKGQRRLGGLAALNTGLLLGEPVASLPGAGAVDPIGRDAAGGLNEALKGVVVGNGGGLTSGKLMTASRTVMDKDMAVVAVIQYEGPSKSIEQTKLENDIAATLEDLKLHQV